MSRTLIASTAVAGALALLATGTAVTQHGDASRAHRALTRSESQLSLTKLELDGSEDNLAKVQASLTSAQGDLRTQAKVLSACSAGIAVGREINDAVSSLVDARSSSYYSQVPYLEAAIDSLRSANRIADDSGYDTIDELFDHCEEESSRRPGTATGV